MKLRYFQSYVELLKFTLSFAAMTVVVCGIVDVAVWAIERVF